MVDIQSSREFPAWMNNVKYQEGAIVIKDGTLCSYWKYPKNGEMVWLPLDNPEKYDMLLTQDSLIYERDVKDLIISWNEEKGFYCGELSDQFFSDLLIDLIHKYSLKIDDVKFTSETSMYFTLQEANKAEYNIILKDEDGSDWIFG